MPFSMTVNNGKQILNLEGRVTIRNARELGLLISDSLEATLPVEVETEQLTDVDTCVLQLLLSLRRSVSQLTLVNPCQALLGALDRSQLRRQFLDARETL
jgi:anti-anti-sigma regulatory factor